METFSIEETGERRERAHISSVYVHMKVYRSVVHCYYSGHDDMVRRRGEREREE